MTPRPFLDARFLERAALLAAALCPVAGLAAQASWTQLASGPGVPDMIGAGVAYDESRDRLVVFGGFSCSLPSGRTWEWDGTSWQGIVSPTSPPWRTDPAMVYDPHRKRTIMFGGDRSRDLDDLWEWDGTTWTERVAGARPPARKNHVMAYDESRRCVVLYGGKTSGATVFDDTWIWDGTSWHQRTPATRPQRRSHAAMAYDPVRERVVMFGGIIRDPVNRAIRTDETWEWDGTDWHLQQPAARPPGRSSPGLAYDPQRGQTIMFGGVSSSNFYFLGTWAWDGQQWTQLATTGPFGRGSHGMVYDSRRGQVLVSGGGIGGMFGVSCFPNLWALSNPVPGFSAFGAGCPGSTGMLQLSPLSAVPGIQGGPLPLRLSNVPTTSGTALFALGLSRNKWNSLSLPWTMTILGAPSCSLWAAPEVLLGAPVSGNVADLTLQIPSNQGFEFHVQGVALDAGVSRGFALSHGATVIGQ